MKLRENRCAFDSVLHSTVCSNLNPNTHPNVVEQKLSKNCNRNKNKQSFSENSTPVLKLKTSLLNQLNPNLTPEETFNRKLYDIEKWLYDRETFEPDAKSSSQTNSNKSTPVAAKISCQTDNASKKSMYLLPHQLKQHKEAINSTKIKAPFEHWNTVPISGNASEFETLIDLSENEEENNCASPDCLDTVSKSSSVRFVHIHHHFYHFDNDEK